MHRNTTDPAARQSNDPLRAARGILLALVLGSWGWVLFFLFIGWQRA